MGTLVVRGILALAFLLTVVFPAWAQNSKGVGVVTGLTGRADLRRPQAPQAQALKLRDNLFVSDVVDTRKESLARILLLGKSTVTVRELSRFEIWEETLPDGAQRAVINLAVGKIRVMVARRLMKPGDEIQIRTPNAISSVRGSEGIFEVTALPDGRAQTEVFGISGEFEVTIPTAPPITAMAEVVSDAPPGILLAQGPASYVVGGVGIPNNVLRFVGFPPVVASRTGTLLEALQQIRLFQGPSLGSLSGNRNAPTSNRAAAAGIPSAFATREGAAVMSNALTQIARNPVPTPVIPPPVILPTTSSGDQGPDMLCAHGACAGGKKNKTK